MYISSDRDKTPAMSQKELSPTVGGVASTNYILSKRGITELRNSGVTESRLLCPLAFLRKGGVNNNTLYYVPSLFLEKAGDNNHEYA